MKRGLACLVWLVPLAACNLAPPHVRPVAPIPQGFDHRPSSEPTDAPSAWQSYFGDPRLRAYIAAALVHNRDLAQSIARVAQARARFGIEESQRAPQIVAEASAAEQDTVSIMAPALLGVRITNFELDLWGRARNVSEAQRRNYLAEVEAMHAFRLSLIGQVAGCYFRILEGEERIATGEHALGLRREALRLARRRLDAGVDAAAEYDRAVILVAQAQAELAELKHATAQARNLLMVLVGGPSASALPNGLPLHDIAQLAPVEPGLPSEVLARRPDIRRAEERLRAANADIGAARAAFFPSISLSAAGGFLSMTLRDLVSGEAAGYQISGSSLLPIFDGGRRRAQLRLTQAEASERVAAYQFATQQAFREVADALVGRRRYIEQIAAQADTVAAMRRLLQVARKRMDNGVGTRLQVLNAERDLFEAEQKLIGLRSAELQNGAALYVALGGGYS